MVLVEIEAVDALEVGGVTDCHAHETIAIRKAR